MDDAEIERLRKAIRRTYASQPHKIKCWLALLEMYAKRQAKADDAEGGAGHLALGGDAGPAQLRR